MRNKRLEVAIKAAEAGGKITMRFFRKGGIVVKEKEVASDIVTQVDKESGEEIISIINSFYPDDNILTEEEGFTDKGSEFTWVVDDLDGTNPFRAGLPNFGISVGCLYKNEPYLGAICLPFFDEVFSAEKNKGAFLNGRKIEVNKIDVLKKARLCVDYGHFGFRREDLEKTSFPLIEEALFLDSYGCAVEALSFVACGRLSVYLHHRAFPWDFCAGTIIVQEAGGRVTDHQGKPLDWTKKENMFILASNGLIHDQILKILNSKL